MRILLLLLGLATGVASSAAVAQTSARIDTVSIASRLLANRRTLRVLLPPGYDDPTNADRRYPFSTCMTGRVCSRAVVTGWAGGMWTRPSTG